MIFILNETQLREIFKPSFQFRDLDGKSDDELYQYCTENLGTPIGKGSSRACFEYDNEIVIKIALNEDGYRQNKTEIDYYLSHAKSPIIPKIYHYDKSKFQWIIIQKVMNFNSEEECEEAVREILGVTYEEYSEDGVSLVDICDIMELIYNHNEEYADEDDLLFVNNLMKYRWFKALYQYICDNHGFIDISYGNIGVAETDNSKEIVLLDTGMDNNLYNDYNEY